MRNISKELQKRIIELDVEIEKVKQNLTNLNTHRAGLQMALENEQRRWGKPEKSLHCKDTDSNDSIIGNKSGLKLSDVVLKCLDIGGKTVKTLKQDVKNAGIDLGKNQGRAIHTALYGLSKRDLAEKFGDLWKLKPVNHV